MILKKVTLGKKIECCVIIEKDQLRWLSNSMNEVLNGIHVDASQVLGAPESELKNLHHMLLDQYRSIIDESVEIVVDRQAFIILRKAIFAVMRDFNKYNEYGTRLGIEFEDYLGLLSNVDDILDSCFELCMSEK